MIHKPQSIFEAARAVLEGSESRGKEILAEGKAEASASKVSAAAGEVEDALKSANKCLDKLIDAVNKAQEHYEDANGILPAEFKTKVKEFNAKLSQLGGETIEDAEEPAEEEEEELEDQEEEELEDQEEGNDPFIGNMVGEDVEDAEERLNHIDNLIQIVSASGLDKDLDWYKKVLFLNPEFKDGNLTPSELKVLKQAMEEDADINEDYIEVMDSSLLHKAKDNILTAWKQWRRGPETERQDIKPAAAELKKDLTDWMKKNIK